MGLDIVKKLKGQAKDRQRTGGAAAKAKPKYEPPHRFFVSNNWKNLLDKRPSIAPKAAAAKQAPSEFVPPDVVAVDCEMVGVGPDKDSALARVSIVNHDERVLLDRYVQPKEKITDFRTHVSGITPALLKGPKVVSEHAAQQLAAQILEGKVVIGHSVESDFQALGLSHPHQLIRDTALFRPLRPPGYEQRTPSLKRLATHWLQLSIHDGKHDSVEDARVALRLYRLKSRAWEKQMRSAMQSRFSASHAAAAGQSAGAGAGAATTGVDSSDEGEFVEPKGTRPGKKRRREREATPEAAQAPAGKAGKKKGKKRRAPS
mmetsp:Transcript_22048/g.50380  ORF Transcript_22048/g.50380 Transcript_22048/m.50380 type:complete len:317 (+) Transcript_22048:111-1061(+)